MTRDWSAPIEGQFYGIDGHAYMMNSNGDVYRTDGFKFEPVTKSYYGHILKTSRKAYMREIAEKYRRRSLYLKQKDYISADNYTQSIKRMEERFNSGINKTWETFRFMVASGRAERRLDRIITKGKPMTFEDWKAQNQ